MKIAPALVLVFVACGGATAPTEAPATGARDRGAPPPGSASAPASANVIASPPARESPPTDADTARTRVVAQKSSTPPFKGACPPKFGGGSAPTCAKGEDPGPCTYPEGTCMCRMARSCGGAARGPTPPEWICEAPRPPCPAEGTACKGNQTCHDGECPWSGVHECREGKWRTVMVPPPP